MFELDHDSLLSRQRSPKKWFIVKPDPKDPYYRCKYQQAFDSVLVIASNVNQNSKKVEDFQDLVKKRSPDPPFYSTAYNDDSETKRAYVSCCFTLLSQMKVLGKCCSIIGHNCWGNDAFRTTKPISNVG